MNSPRVRYLPLLLLPLLAGCASLPAEPPKIERVSAEQIEARLPQPAAALPLEQLVTLTQQGIGADELIGRIVASASRYRLSATQLLDLARQGVPLKVLDHLVASERARIFDDLASDATRREQACRDRLEQEMRLCRSPPLAPMWFPGPQPLMNCFPLAPGSPFWRCL